MSDDLVERLLEAGVVLRYVDQKQRMEVNLKQVGEEFRIYLGVVGKSAVESIKAEGYLSALVDFEMCVKKLQEGKDDHSAM